MRSKFTALKNSVFILLLAVPMFSTPARALEAPKSQVVLKVTGSITETNDVDAALFDEDMLMALEQAAHDVETPWFDGVNHFEGPLLRAVLQAVGAKGSRLTIKALNDYSAEVPADDARTFDTILAMTRNGELMSVRDKGPLFLIYPFSKHPEIYNEQYFNRSVWQISEISVED